jgi:Mrp family chromosome partitioning ATPase
MDHIRAAIDKARLERSAVGGSVFKGSKRPTDQAGKADDASSPDEWQELISFDVAPRQLRRHRIMTQQANPMATTFDAMRTRLLHEMRTNNWRRVAITSPGASCGKSTICMNLAFSLARQSDIRVMVIELDLRRPAIAGMLQLEGVNFSRVLSGEDAAAHHLRRYGNSLAIGASLQTANSAELLQGLTAAHQIDEIEARYQPDLMLFDMPPLLLVDDTMAFIDQVDAALLVGAAEGSTTKELSRCKQDLESRTNLIGVVLNKCRYLDPAEGYGYGG